jgi:hypothetical protein
MAKPERLVYLRFKSVKNSSLAASDLILPSIQIVVVALPTFCTPRISIQRCEHSITTPTPYAPSKSEMAVAIWLVKRS